MNQQIAIYYEHPEWFSRLFAVLEKRGIGYAKSNAGCDFYNPNENFAEKVVGKIIL